MKCEKCMKNEAEIEINQLVDGQKKTIRLCERCAQSMNTESPLMTNRFMAGLLDTIHSSGLQVNYIKTTTCSHCGMTYGRFRELGVLGCEQCYQTFEEKLKPLVRRIHGSDQHTGKMPIRYHGVAKVQKEIQRLKNEMEQSVRREAFEEAAVLRDRIKTLEQSLNSMKTQFNQSEVDDSTK